jgi:hypothetical protein
METGRYLHEFAKFPVNPPKRFPQDDRASETQKRVIALYGLELTDECGTAIGPAAFSSSPRPMHSPELCPVQGMPPISGRPPTGAVLEKSGEFGTTSGTQILVNWSSVSPPAHAEIDGADVPFVGTANIATAGAAAIATANPPARISRRVGRCKVAIVTLSLSLLTVSFEKRLMAVSDLAAVLRFPADA